MTWANISADRINSSTTANSSAPCIRLSVSRHRCAKSNSVFQIMDIGASTDGQTLSFPSGIILIGPKKCFYKIRVPIHMVRRRHGLIVKSQARPGHIFANHFKSILLIGADRTPAVEHSIQASLINIQHSESQSQFSGQIIFHLNAKSFSGDIPVGNQIPKLLQVLCLRAFCQGQPANQLQKEQSGHCCLPPVWTHGHLLLPL